MDCTGEHVGGGGGGSGGRGGLDGNGGGPMGGWIGDGAIGGPAAGVAIFLGLAMSNAMGRTQRDFDLFTVHCKVQVS